MIESKAKFLLPFFYLFISLNCNSQGITNLWLLGYSGGGGKMDINFTTGSPVVSLNPRIMNMDATATCISDAQGNFLFSSNGIFIQNANNDTMLNGSGLNPGPFTSLWNNSFGALPIIQGNLILSFPGNSEKYILFHETYTLTSNSYSILELFYSIINMSLDGGLGGVTQKNQIASQDTLIPGMLTACRHANGRDWWVITHEDSGAYFYKVLVTPDGIESISQQIDSGPLSHYGGSACFSPDGTKYVTLDNLSKLRIYDFDRCTGDITNLRYIILPDTYPQGGVAFSPNSRFLYANSINYIYQFDVTAANVASTQTLVATFDGYYSPSPPFACNFLLQQLGPDGKIYINSANSVVDLHAINYPDSAGIACNVCQHCIHLPAYNAFSIPNHPNYFLGPEIGSICDSLDVGINERAQFSFNFSVYPNPVQNNILNITYLLPQNQKGILEMFDVSGKKKFSYSLPQWSTLQRLQLPRLSRGIY
ncbi:MAG: T9SS type A sorting domain-containing protein, partial [Bacteroidia bacterium]|nr:T9SS type A sorting domain-containing protein [Bacteroidia bacterium]